MINTLTVACRWESTHFKRAFIVWTSCWCVSSTDSLLFQWICWGLLWEDIKGDKSKYMDEKCSVRWGFGSSVAVFQFWGMGWWGEKAWSKAKRGGGRIRRMFYLHPHFLCLCTWQNHLFCMIYCMIHALFHNWIRLWLGSLRAQGTWSRTKRLLAEPELILGIINFTPYVFVWSLISKLLFMTQDLLGLYLAWWLLW